MATILEVQNLYKSFGGVKAVIDVSFNLSDGQLLAMIGPNGAGKSTCFNLINGQLQPDRGTVVILGKKVNRRKPRDVWNLGVGRTFQITSTFVSMSVLENVQMAMLSYYKRTKSLLKKVSRLYVDESMELLRLVGASSNYISMPFFMEGALQGLLGSAGGLAALYLLFNWMKLRFAVSTALTLFDFTFFPMPVILSIIAVSTLLCGSGSFSSTRKFLQL